MGSGVARTQSNSFTCCLTTLVPNVLFTNLSSILCLMGQKELLSSFFFSEINIVILLEMCFNISKKEFLIFFFPLHYKTKYFVEEIQKLKNLQCKLNILPQCFLIKRYSV